MCRLLLVDGAEVDTVIKENNAEHILVYYLVDRLPPPSPSPSSPSSDHSLTIGQLLVLFYRLLGGEKCFIYTQEDAITILKMGQMKLGDEVSFLTKEKLLVKYSAGT